jgi:eukaryotic-like serine/threonine-protein kinase
MHQGSSGSGAAGSPLTGQILLQYQFGAKLGAGGMGVVYKARDMRLGREVAIKVLPADMVGDADRRERFVYEARAASRLNHPNIITIHDFCEAEGIYFMVMELVQGKTMNELIRGKPMPLDQALHYAIQIADAVAAAHAAGIIHRDLKPANIMVTEKRMVKVLDFGLAKLTDRLWDSASTQTLTLTEPSPQTDEGKVVGTVAYMSPEQAEGKVLNRGTDVFSFGAVLYEMVTGKRAFKRETKIATLAAILREEPPPPSQLVSDFPRDVERLIARCLRKDPQRRYQHMPDVKIALEDLKEESASITGMSAVSLPARRRSRKLLVAGVASLALFAAAGWWVTRNRPAAVARLPVLRRLTSDAGLTTEPALSPDGKFVAFASDRASEGNLDIWVQLLAGGEPSRLTRHAADDREPSFSPDGSKIAFRSDRDGGGIYVVSTLGGKEQKIADQGRRPRFSPDGKWIAYWVGEPGTMPLFGWGASLPRMGMSGVFLVPAGGGTPRPFRPGFFAARNPLWSPDGKHLLIEGVDKFTAAAPASSRYDWYVAARDSDALVKTGAFDVLRKYNLFPQEPGMLTSYPAPGAWADGRIVFSAAVGDTTNLWQLPISEAFQVSGPPGRLTAGAGVEGNPSIASSEPGRKESPLVYSSLTENGDIWSLPIDTDRAKVLGPLQRLTKDVAADIRPSISADGTRMVYNSNRLGNWDVWVMDLRTGKEDSLTATPEDEENPKITLDGSKVVFSVSEGQKRLTYVVAATGGVPRKVCDDCWALPWFADGRRILFNSPGFIKAFDTESAQTTELLRISSLISAPRPSWDDRWIAFYHLLDPIHSRIFIAPIHNGAVTEESEFIAVSDGTTYDLLPEFSPDGRLLYFLSQRDGARCLWAQRLDPATKRPLDQPFPVQHFHSARVSPLFVKAGQRAISVARDKIVITMDERVGNVWMSDFGAR